MKFFVDTEFLEDGKTIELISVGVVAEDGREYYAEVALDEDLLARIQEQAWLMENVWPHLKGEQKPRDVIAQELQEFTRCRGNDSPEFWAFNGAYDWVVLNQLFGAMVDHPRQWPFYCNDIAQYAMHVRVNRRKLPAQTTTQHDALDDARWTRDTFNWLELIAGKEPLT